MTVTHTSVSLIGYELGLWQLVVGTFFPVFCVKQVINILILKAGCQAVAWIDVEERAKLRAAAGK